MVASSRESLASSCAKMVAGESETTGMGNKRCAIVLWTSTVITSSTPEACSNAPTQAVARLCPAYCISTRA